MPFAEVDIADKDDYGADVVSTPVENCVKYLLLYPPTQRNLTTMRVAEGQRGKLLRDLNRLEARIVVETTAAHALSIPASCVHATVLLYHGGQLSNCRKISQRLSPSTLFVPLLPLDRTLPFRLQQVTHALTGLSVLWTFLSPNSSLAWRSKPGSLPSLIFPRGHIRTGNGVPTPGGSGNSILKIISRLCVLVERRIQTQQFRNTYFLPISDFCWLLLSCAAANDLNQLTR
jgi:hypothetical protein